MVSSLFKVCNTQDLVVNKNREICHMRIKSTIKKIYLLTIYMAVSTFCVAQTAYLSNPDSKNPGGIIFKGMITKYLLENEASFKWYNNNKKNYQPEMAVINAMEASKDKVSFILFGGTWCDDTQSILPEFFKLQELSGFPDSAVTFFGVDRDKKTLGGISEAFNITNVPTIIVMKNGKEKGRVVEYGTTGKWDSDLYELLK